MTVYDWSKVSRETLEELADALAGYRISGDASYLHQVADAAEKQALVPPLRTRAEVDAEIALHVRSIGAESFKIGGRFTHLCKLCAEPLAPETSFRVAAKRWRDSQDGSKPFVCPVCTKEHLTGQCEII